MMFSGLILIACAWILQFHTKKKELNKTFVLVYALGVFILVVDALYTGVYLIALVNAIPCVLATLLYLRLKK